MAKAYNMVNWVFLIKVLERIRFDKNWETRFREYQATIGSILINGQSFGFFHSIGGRIKHGDPLSLALFIYLQMSLHDP